MAEDTDIALEDGAPAAPPSPKGDQLSELSIEELAEAVASRIYRDDQSQADKAVAALRKELLPYLEDGRRTSEEVKQTTALVRALAREGTLTEAQLESIDKAHVEAARLTRLESERAELLAANEALEKRGLPEEQIFEAIDRQVKVSAIDEAVLYARDQGFSDDADNSNVWEAIRAAKLNPTERTASPGDEHGIRRWLREIKANIRKDVDAKAHDAEPPTNMPQARTQGGGGTEADYQKWLRGEGPKPSDAEIDRMTASYLTRR